MVRKNCRGMKHFTSDLLLFNYNLFKCRDRHGQAAPFRKG
jgi:hypothetical protein